MRNLTRSCFGVALLLSVATPSWAGIHYKAVTTVPDARNGNNQIVVEGWVAGDKAKVLFRDSGNPMMKKGSYLLTKDGGRTLYLVDPEEKTYAEWDLQAMLGTAGAVLQGMGPLLKIEFSDPKVEKVSEGDGGSLLGLPTRHVKSRTSYSMKIKVLGMGQASNVVSEQEIWATDKLKDVGLGVWLRADPPRTGNENFDKLVAAQASQVGGFPLKTVTVSTTTNNKGKQQVSRTSTEVTELDAAASVPDATFEIPGGYEETQLVPMSPGQ